MGIRQYLTPFGFVSEGLEGLPVALRPTLIEDIYDIYFCHQHVKQVNLLDYWGVYHVCEHVFTMYAVYAGIPDPTPKAAPLLP